MKIVSPAGDITLGVGKIYVEDNQLVQVGRMGVWDARVYITEKDVQQIIRDSFNAPLLVHVLGVATSALEQVFNDLISRGQKEVQAKVQAMRQS